MIDFTSILEVSIDFSQSHLVFPRIIMGMLVAMLLVITVVYRQRLLQILANPAQELQFFDKHADKFRLFFTIGLVTIYIYAMDFVGAFFPNQGLGFLFCSIVFMFILSYNYAHQRTRKVLITIACNSIIAPLVAWYVLGQLFDITLP